jgi:hypothetical protein
VIAAIESLTADKHGSTRIFDPVAALPNRSRWLATLESCMLLLHKRSARKSASRFPSETTYAAANDRENARINRRDTRDRIGRGAKLKAPLPAAPWLFQISVIRVNQW